MDIRFLTKTIQDIVLGIVDKVPADLKSKIIIIR